MQMHATQPIAAASTRQRPEFSDIIARIRKLQPAIAARALSTEKAKRVPAETMDALRDADVFRAMQPVRFGGYEYGPAELAQIGFELGRACGSTGWCGTLAVCFGWMTAFFPLEAQQEVWDDPDNLLAVSYTPSPKVEEVDGGYKITGSWPWASGVDSAAWLILAALLPGKGGPPTLAWCLVPVGDVVIDHNSWNVSGLEGHRIEDRLDFRAGVRSETSRAADRRDFFRPGSRTGRTGQRPGALRLSDFRSDRAGLADRRHGAGRARCLHRNGPGRAAHGAARRVREGRRVAADPEPGRPGRGPHRCGADADGDEPA